MAIANTHNGPLTVYTLLTNTRDGHWQSQTMGLHHPIYNIRTAFPTAKIYVHYQDRTQQLPYGERYLEVQAWARVLDLDVIPRHHVTHYDFIRDMIYGDSGPQHDNPMVICDLDSLFFDDMESLVHSPDPNTTYSGVYVPPHRNPYSQCHYMDRIHTCMMIIPSPAMLRLAIHAADPLAGKRETIDNEYCQIDLFTPRVVYNENIIFYDTCAQLYHAVSSRELTHKERQQFFHLNSASFYKQTLNRLPDPLVSKYEHMHHMAMSDPETLRFKGWQWIDDLYESNFGQRDIL